MFKYTADPHIKHEYESARTNWRNINATFNLWRSYEQALGIHPYDSYYVFWLLMSKQFEYYSPTKLKHVPVNGYPVPVVFFKEELID